MNAVALILAASNVSALSLQIDTTQRHVLVGEPLKLRATWRALESLSVAIEDADFSFKSVVLEVRRGTERVFYHENSHRTQPDMLVRRTLAAGEQVSVDLVFVKGWRENGRGETADHSHALLPTAGEYTLRALYVGDGPARIVSSNVVRVVADWPTGSEGRVWQAVVRDPNVAIGQGSIETQQVTKRLLDEYPQSRYLRLAWLEHFDVAVDALGSRLDPDTGQSFRHLGELAGTAFVKNYYARMLGEIVSVSDWGPFEPEALAHAAKFALQAGDVDRSQKIEEELLRKYPNTTLATLWRPAQQQTGAK